MRVPYPVESGGLRRATLDAIQSIERELQRAVGFIPMTNDARQIVIDAIRDLKNVRDILRD